MKKLIILAAIATFVFAGTAFAGTEITISNGKEATGQKGTEAAQSIGKLSNNVGASFNYTNATYAVITKHEMAIKEYGSSSDDTKLFYQAATKGDAPSGPGTSGSDAFNGWASL